MKQITLEEALEGIMPADQEAQEIARKRWDSIAKPLYSLGWMEDAVARIAGAQHTSQIRTEKKILVPLCADNGRGGYADRPGCDGHCGRKFPG